MDCVLNGDLDLARSLIRDNPESLSWSLPYCLVTCELLRLRSPRQEAKEVKVALLQEIRAQCDKAGYTWSEENLERSRQFAESLTHQDPVTRSLIRAGSHLVSALHTASDPGAQESLGHVATCVSLLTSAHVPHDTSMAGLRRLLPAGVATPPDVGKAVLGRDLDWQCNWIQVSSRTIREYPKFNFFKYSSC